MLARLLMAIGIALAPVAVHAQDRPPPAPPAPAPPPDPSEISFQDRAQYRMTVPATVGAAGPFAFVVDTGAERSVISAELARSLSLAAGPPARLFDFAGLSVVGTARVPALAVSPLPPRAMEAPVLGAGNLGAQGMIGIDMLQGHKVSIDFQRRRMTLAPAKRHASGEVVLHADDRLGQLVVTNASFYGRPIAVIVDTGSWVSVGNPAMLALMKRAPRVLTRLSVTSVTGKSFDADFVLVDAVKIGGVRFDHFGMVFADVPPFARFGLKDTPALILGMSALKLFRRVEIDFANREIAFTLPLPSINFNDVCHMTSSPCRSL